MARQKEYIKEEVLEKAMHLFWKNGFEKTSMQMLEAEMGINKFSIYSSFGNKKGLFLEGLKCYSEKTAAMFEKFRAARNGVEDIKIFFYDSISPTYQVSGQKGCLLTNTYNEFSNGEDLMIKQKLELFMSDLKSLFIEKLKMDESKSNETILKQANFLLLAKHGLAAASRVNTDEEIQDYIEMTFTDI